MLQHKYNLILTQKTHKHLKIFIIAISLFILARKYLEIELIAKLTQYICRHFR